MKTVMVLFEGVTALRPHPAPRRARPPAASRPSSTPGARSLIWEIAGSGHLDSVAMALIALALLARSRNRPIATGLFLGLAILTKMYPIILLPALYRRGDDWQDARHRRRPHRRRLRRLRERRHPGLRLPLRLRQGGGPRHRRPLLPARLGAPAPRPAPPPARRPSSSSAPRSSPPSASGPGAPPPSPTARRWPSSPPPSPSRRP